jgi:hypothetical protein
VLRPAARFVEVRQIGCLSIANLTRRPPPGRKYGFTLTRGGSAGGGGEKRLREK